GAFDVDGVALVVARRALAHGDIERRDAGPAEIVYVNDVTGPAQHVVGGVEVSLIAGLDVEDFEVFAAQGSEAGVGGLNEQAPAAAGQRLAQDLDVVRVRAEVGRQLVGAGAA